MPPPKGMVGFTIGLSIARLLIYTSCFRNVPFYYSIVAIGECSAVFKRCELNIKSIGFRLIT